MPLSNPQNALHLPDAVAARVRTERLQLLFRQSFLGTFGSIGAGAVLSWFQKDLGHREFILFWLGALCVMGGVRLLMFWAYHQSPGRDHCPEWWERIYWTTLVMAAGTWGFGALVLMSKDSLLSQAITLFFAIGMAGSAISAYSAYRSMTLAAMGLVLLPTALYLLLDSGTEQRLLAAAALAFSGFVLLATKQLSEAMHSLLYLRHALEMEHRIAMNAALTDELTGLNNRRAFFERAEEMFAFTRRHQLPLCALLIDIDHFKKINDTHGHHVGDRVLQAVAEHLTMSLRESDLCGRLGGEEFAVLLAGTHHVSALHIAEKLRLALQLMVVDIDATKLGITVSIGVAEASDGTPVFKDLLAKADAAMYHAKSSGRNRVHSGLEPCLSVGLT